MDFLSRSGRGHKPAIAGGRLLVDQRKSYRRCVIDRAVGRMSRRTTWAADGIAKIAEEATSDSVRLRAFRAIFSDMMTVFSYSGLEVRMTELEEGLRVQAANNGRAV